MSKEKAIILAGPKEIDIQRSPWPEKEAHALADQVRQYFIDRVDLLRQIPELALEADGRTGFSDNFARAYQQCIYPIHSSRGYYDLFVELRTGLLVNIDGYDDHLSDMFPGLSNVAGINVAKDDEVLRLVSRSLIYGGGSPMDFLKIEEFVEDLKEWAKEPYGSYYNKAERKQTDIRRESFRGKLHEMMKATRADLREDLR